MNKKMYTIIILAVLCGIAVAAYFWQQHRQKPDLVTDSIRRGEERQFEHDMQLRFLNESIGKTMAWEGEAQNAKAGAVLMLAGTPVYLEGLNSWPKGFVNKKVSVTGKLAKKQYIPAATTTPEGAVSQGGDGSEDFVLEQAAWKLVGVSAQDTGAPAAEYGTKVEYAAGQKIRFPDFTLEYTREEKKQGPNNAPWSMTFYIFTLSYNSITKEISWSSGTGIVAPNPFEFEGAKYNIEKAFSTKAGKLADNELVINKK